MVREARVGKNFDPGFRYDVKREEHFCCEGCSRREHKHPNPNAIADPDAVDSNPLKLTVHHSPPVALGGGRQSEAWVLCQDGCHRVADELELKYGIAMREVEAVRGRYPLRQYVEDMQRGHADRVAREVARKMNRIH